MFEFKAGSTSNSIYVKLVDSSTFLGKTGLIFSDMTIFYTLNRAAAVTGAPVTLAAPTTAWTSGGFREIDSANQPGLYRYDPPNAACATGPFSVVSFKATNVKDEAVLIKLFAYDPYDAVALGLSAITAINAKTTNLPADPSSAATVAAAITAVPAAVLAAATAAPIATDVKKINATTVNGNGGTIPWGP